jgi:hypothetical protein
MRATNSIALKEWAVLCRELDEGRQILLLRKGGIRESAKGFNVERDEFFLFPTYVHQNGDELSDGARAALPGVEREAPPAGLLRLELYAAVAAATEVTDLNALRRLNGQHALAWPAVERRFHYRRPGLHVIVVRAHRLPQPRLVPNLARYDGCRSWVPLESEYPTTGCHAVLTESEFRRRLAQLEEALEQSLPSR